MDKRFAAHSAAGGAVFTLALLLLTHSAAAKTPAAPSGKLEGQTPLSVTGRTVPGVLVKAERDHDEMDRDRDDTDNEHRARSGKIEGRVLDAGTGRGVPGVLVILERDRDGRRWLSEPTNSSGHYLLKVSLRDPEGEAFHARTRAFDYGDSVGSGSVSLDRQLRLDFSVALRPTATVSGTVFDADTDIGLANARVAVNCLPACNGIPHPPVETGPDGRYELRGVPLSPSDALETGTPLTASLLKCLSSDRYYPLVADRVQVVGSQVMEDFHLTAVRCGQAPPKPIIGAPRSPPSCVGVPIPTDDNNGRLVTSCLGPANETDVAVNPTNPLNIVSVAKDYSLGQFSNLQNDCSINLHPLIKWEVWIGIYTSFDGGVSWSDDLFPGFPGDNRSTGVANQRCMTDPVVAFAPNGDLYLAADAWGAPRPDGTHEYHIVLGKSTDGGLTWGNIQSISDGTADFAHGIWPDKPQLAIDPDYVSNGTLYVGWVQFVEPSETPTAMLTTVVNGTVSSPAPITGIYSLPVPAVLSDHSVVAAGLKPVRGVRRGHPQTLTWVPMGSSCERGRRPFFGL